MKILSEHLKARLASAEITKVAVIDDAFDTSRLMDLVDDVPTFWEELEEQPDWIEQLSANGVPTSSLNDFEVDGLPALWELRTSFSGALGEKIQALFNAAQEKLSAPASVVENLKSLGFEVVVLSSYHVDGADPTEDVQLVFLDYDLEGDASAKPLSTRESHAIAKKLAERGGKSPFIILFSSLDTAEHISEEFRTQALYLKGSFLFLSKAEAANLERLTKSLSEACVWCPSLGHFREFFVTMRQRLQSVTDDLQQTLLSLGVHDYAHFQRVALQGDGAPLGEYMLEIFGAVLSHEFQNDPDIIRARKELDRINLGTLHLPFENQPSAPIETIYRAVLTAPGIVEEPAGPHPRTAGKKWDHQGEELDSPPLLMLGDIFATARDKPVYVVLNSPCEMQYSDQASRRPKFDLSILMMEGRLESLDEPTTELAAERMRWLRFDSHDFRILWQYKSIESIRLREFDKWQREGGFKRVSRLNVAYATSLKQSWLSSLSQIGLATSPPISGGYDLEVFLPEGATWLSKGISPKAGIISSHPANDREPLHFCLTTSGREYVFSCLEGAAESADARRNKSAQDLLKDSDFWWNLVSNFQLLEKKDAVFGFRYFHTPEGGAGMAAVFSNASPTKEFLEACAAKKTVTILIVFKRATGEESIAENCGDCGAGEIELPQTSGIPT